MHHLFLTGAPGVGKSTLLKKVVSRTQVKLAGFVTHEIRENGDRVGFETEVIGGKRYLLAHKYTRIRSKQLGQIGSYTVDVDMVRRVLCPVIRKAIEEGTVLVIDEIARAQLLAGKVFKDAVRAALERRTSTLAIIQNRDDPFTDELKGNLDVEILYVAMTNRGKLEKPILKFLKTGSIEKSKDSSSYRPPVRSASYYADLKDYIDK